MPRKAKPKSLAELFAEHGTRKLRCVCPGCRKMVPACWMAQMCVECATENCEHAEEASDATKA